MQSITKNKTITLDPDAADSDCDSESNDDLGSANKPFNIDNCAEMGSPNNPIIISDLDGEASSNVELPSQIEILTFNGSLILQVEQIMITHPIFWKALVVNELLKIKDNFP
ncbi:Hypothetical predicted protein [Mytilus galloprovincialis]|uniref:Uncharacterized protein n=1 Tax=Mytilus galloprovincialis TaxID=29158 RepID=A0A8B6DCR2_MYTGA|nr:Hypothetical predicted protein [Mytilus galloprovincialis]